LLGAIRVDDVPGLRQSVRPSGLVSSARLTAR